MNYTSLKSPPTEPVAAPRLDELAEALCRNEPEQPQRVPPPFFYDPFIEQVCRALVSDLETGALSESRYADALARALTPHLRRHYAGLTTGKALPPRGLSQQQLRLTCDFIDDFLATEVSLSDLAALTGLSPAAFAKGFKRATGLPPNQYLIQRRVERAKGLLKDATLTVAEVAQAVGFFDQSHLVRHFKYWVGVTPKDYRERQQSN